MSKGDFNPPAVLEMSVVRRGETTVRTARLECPAEFCYRLFCRVDDVPGWLWVVGRAVTPPAHELSPPAARPTLRR